MKVTTEDLVNLEEIFMMRGSDASMEVSDADALKMKSNMKELDARAFRHEERQTFDEADAAEWKQFLASGSVTLVPSSLESSIPEDKILSAPMRFLNTNKSKEPRQTRATSRLIIPGHRDPQMGL